MAQAVVYQVEAACDATISMGHDIKCTVEEETNHLTRSISDIMDMETLAKSIDKLIHPKE